MHLLHEPSVQVMPLLSAGLSPPPTPTPSPTPTMSSQREGLLLAHLPTPTQALHNAWSMRERDSGQNKYGPQGPWQCECSNRAADGQTTPEHWAESRKENALLAPSTEQA